MCDAFVRIASLISVMLAASGARLGPDETNEEPTYKGKTLRQWMAAMGDANKGYNSGAIHSLGEMGPDAKAAIPALIEALHDKEAYWPAKIGRASCRERV